MEQTNCLSIRDSLVAFLGQEIQVIESKDGCVLVLPGKTLDDRQNAIFIDQRMPDFFLVHDAGKTTAELHAQGVHITDTREQAFAQMADRLGAVFSNGVFQIGCNRDELYHAILAVGQCESLGMWHLLGHKADFSDEPIRSRVDRGLKAWKAPYETQIGSDIYVSGRHSKHKFEFVSFPKNVPRETIAIKILRPGDDALSKAKEYGYLALDIEKTQYDQWRRLAVMTKADRWTKNAREIVENLSSATVEVESGEEDAIERIVPEKLDQIAA